MKRNEIRAGQEIAKLGAQSFIAFFFALIIQITAGKITLPELHYGLVIFSILMIAYFIRRFKYYARELDKIEE